MNRGRRATLLLLAGAGSGCVSIGTGGDAPAHAYLRLQDAGDSARRSAPLVDALLIQPEPGDALADTVSIAFARTPNVFGYYQFASWTERPVRRLPQLLQRRLEARGVAGAVGQIGDPLRADWLLSLRIDTVHHDVSAAPGRAKLGLTATLVDRRRRVQRARQSFEADVGVATADAPAAAAALSQATAQAFDLLLPWLEDALAAALARPAG